eukprot:5649173-Pleurochrysis_carterae.AAC.3
MSEKGTADAVGHDITFRAVTTVATSLTKRHSCLHHQHELSRSVLEAGMLLCDPARTACECTYVRLNLRGSFDVNRSRPRAHVRTFSVRGLPKKGPSAKLACYRPFEQATMCSCGVQFGESCTQSSSSILERQHADCTHRLATKWPPTPLLTPSRSPYLRMQCSARGLFMYASNQTKSGKSK